MKTSFFWYFRVHLNVFRLPDDWCSVSMQGWMHVYTAHQQAKRQVDYGMSWEHTCTIWMCCHTDWCQKESHLLWGTQKMPDHEMKCSVHHRRMIRISWIWVTAQIEPLVLNHHGQPDGHWRRDQSRQIKTRRSQRLKGAGLFLTSDSTNPPSNHPEPPSNHPEQPRKT